MAEADWTVLEDSLATNTIDRGATAGLTPPAGGDDFVYAFNSLLTTTGAAGLFYNGENFAPAAKGMLVSGCVQRGPGGGATGFAPCLFAAAQGNSVNDNAYMLGLSDEDPHRIVLRKGSIVTGIGASDGGGVLRSSTETFVQGTWLHLRLDVVVNDNGDVVLNCYRNDLTDNPLDDPRVWEAIPGMTEFVDDALGINSGSQPYTSGRMGFAFRSAAVTRRGYFDAIEIRRQT